MGVVFIKTIHKKHGFTLVELIVVLSILAILATLLIPSLTGYIEKAKKQAVLTEAKEVWTAAQAALSECYAMYPESFEESCKFTSTIGGEKMTKLGRISNGALMLFKGIPKIRPRSIHPAGELQDKYLFIWKVQIKMQNRAIHSAMVRFLPGTADQTTILKTNRLQKISLFRFSIRKKKKSLQSILEKMDTW